MITIIETWHLTADAAANALAVMQEMDELLEDNAHQHPGWSGHARFFQHADNPTTITLIYPWSNADDAARLLESEIPLLKSFYEAHCNRDREVILATELPVDV